MEMVNFHACYKFIDLDKLQLYFVIYFFDLNGMLFVLVCLLHARKPACGEERFIAQFTERNTHLVDLRNLNTESYK